ncbi:MAG: hypothetical protein ACKVQU_21340 [Burkholderiales bacterium]
MIKLRIAAAVGFLAMIGPKIALAQASLEATSGAGLQSGPAHFGPVVSNLGTDSANTPGLRIRAETPSYPDLAAIGPLRGIGFSATPRTSSLAQWSASWQALAAGLAFGYVGPSRDETLRGPGMSVDTTSMVLTGAYRFAANWDITGGYAATIGESTQRTFDGVLRRPLFRTHTLSLGLGKNETWLRGDRLALSLGHPDRTLIGAGEIPLEIADHIGFDGSYRVPPRTGMRELLTELNYFAPFTRYTGLGLSLVNRSRLTAESNLSDERIMSIRFSTRF